MSLRTVYNLLSLKRERGSLAPKPHAGGFVSRVDEAAKAKVRGLVMERPDATLAELCASLAEGGGPAIRKSRMGQVLAALGLPRKKGPAGV